MTDCEQSHVRPDREQRHSLQTPVGEGIIRKASTPYPHRPGAIGCREPRQVAKESRY
jgi:hypothetical protein